MTKKDKQMQQLKEYCENKEKLKDYLVGGNHRIPKTRREFMASGLMGMTTALAAPTLVQLISSSAWAQEDLGCPSPSAAGGNGNAQPLFIHIQLAGGPALYAQYAGSVAGSSDGVEEPGRMGIGPNPTYVSRFANAAPFVQSSRMLQAMDAQLDGLEAAVYNKSTFVGVACSSLDDRNTNMQDATPLLEAAGIIGSKLPFAIVGSDNSRFRPAIFPQRPGNIRIQNASSMEGALGVAGALGTFPGNQNAIHVSLVSLIEDLNRNQVRDLASDPNSHASQAAFKKLIQCAAKKNVENMASQDNVDFLDGNVGDFADAAGFAQAFNAGGNNMTRAAGQAIGAGLTGLTGAVSIVLSGYDYHGTRSRGDGKDEEFGDLVGRILKGANAAGKPVFIYVSADGSINGPNSATAGANSAWGGDAGTRGMGYMISFDPSVADGATASNFGGVQFGNYTDANHQLNHFIGTSVGNLSPLGDINNGSSIMASAVVLNYFNALGNPGLIDKIPMAKALLQERMPNGTNLADFYTRIKPKA